MSEELLPMTASAASGFKSEYRDQGIFRKSENASSTWPASFDWALLSLRICFGMGLFFKHGTEKLIFFRLDRFAYTLNIGPVHLTHIPDFYIALLSDSIFSALVALGIGTRWSALFCWCNILVAWGSAKHWQFFGFGLKSDHGELILLYLLGFATIAIMGPGRFSLDWKLGTDGFWPCRRKALAITWPGREEPMMSRGIWIVVILAIGMIGVSGIRAQMSVRAHPYDQGQNSPGFNLLSQDGIPVSLGQFRGKWVVLFAYSKKDLHIYLPDYLLQVPSNDASLENDNEVSTFQRDLSKYRALNAEVVGLSPDSVEEHRALAGKEGLGFPLLTPDKRLWDSLGVPISGAGENASVERDTFLISPSGFIAKVWFVKDVQSHSDEVLSTIRAAQQRGYVIDSLRESPI